MAWYRNAEHSTTKLIFCCFGLDPDLLELTKPLDDECFFAEARSFWGAPQSIAPEVEYWRHTAAETAFHCLAHELNLQHIIWDTEQ